MGWSSRVTRLNLHKILKVFVFIEMLYWFIIGTITLMVFNFKDRNNPDVLNDIKADYGSRKQNVEAEAKYRALIREWQYYTNWIVVTAALQFCVQLFLYFGLVWRNRCLIFSWILFTLAVGIIRSVVIATATVSSAHSYLKYAEVSWLVAAICIYFAAKYMLQITNENIGSEELEPPSFRPQSDDPREFREGFNYPTYPRTLTFFGRIAALNKEEHAHPKRWVPTYDAWDQEGRMVVVVDDPVYEAL